MNKLIPITIILLTLLPLGILNSVSPKPMPAPQVQPQPLAKGSTVQLTPVEQLGKALFFDENLSKYRNQSCASCHDPAVGYTGGADPEDSWTNILSGVYAGSDAKLFGNTKPPSAAYAGDSPVLHYDEKEAEWVGGMFNDGRASGKELGDPLAEQAKGPFLNPLEMALNSADELRQRVKESSYVALFNQAWGQNAIDANVTVVYNQIGKSLAAYERSVEVNPHNSKFDLFWDNAKTQRLDVTQIGLMNWPMYRNLGLSDNELYGLAVFNDPMAADCASCHSLKPGSGGYPLFTDYAYDNIGGPRNPQNPYYTSPSNAEGVNWVDKGLGGYFEQTQPANATRAMGLIKTPTLRNVDKRPSADFVRAYGHNGVFKSLPQVIDFYWTRSWTMCMGGMGMRGVGMRGMGWMMVPPPEVNMNIALTNSFPRGVEPYLYLFLTTLSDGYFNR
ncbi:MAG: cytochrome-c peroxidase [Candidatus Bathyarchaeia archaeon]